MKIETAAVWGAGAVGSYFIWGLSEKMGERFCVIAEGERKTRLEEKGLLINGTVFCPRVCVPEEAHGVDLLLVAVKYGALSEVAEKIGQVVGENTVVLSLLNGVDSEEILGKSIGMERILFSMMQIASQRTGSEIHFYPERTPGLFFGEAKPIAPAVQAVTDAAVSSKRVEAIADLLSDTPVRYHISENILREIWLKFAFNVSMNLPQAIIGCGIGAMADSVHMAAMRRALRDEVTAVAAAKGIDISVPSAIERLKYPSAPASRYSTLQDLDAKRPTEIDMFAGTVVRLGQELGVATPCSEFVYHAVRALEEKNAGKFQWCDL